MTTLAAVEHLVGLQAQVPSNPYGALWSRLEGFRPESLAQLFEHRRVVRLPLMRATIHLVSAADCLALRPLVQPVLDAELARHPEYGPALRDVDLAPVLAVASELLAERPRTGPELRAALATQFPDACAAALAYACRNRLALVQVPPRGMWGRSAAVTTTTAEAWLGRPLDPAPSLENTVVRYLTAFGPATVADVTAWSSADLPSRRRRAPSSTTPDLPRRARAGAVRPPRRTAARPRHAGAAALPPGVRQRAPVACRP